MSNGELLIVLVLVAIGRTGAFNERRQPASSLDGESYKPQKFLAWENDDDTLHFHPDDNSIIFSEDGDSGARRLIFLPRDSEGPVTAKLGAGLTLFGIPFGAEIGYSKKRSMKSASPLRRAGTFKSLLVPVESLLDQEEQEEEQQQPKRSGEQESARAFAKQRVIFSEQKVHSIRQQEQEPKRAILISEEPERRSGGEISAGLEFFGIPIGSKLVYEKEDEDDALLENDCTSTAPSRHGKKYKLATKLILG